MKSFYAAILVLSVLLTAGLWDLTRCTCKPDTFRAITTGELELAVEEASEIERLSKTVQLLEQRTKHTAIVVAEFDLRLSTVENSMDICQ